METRRTLDQLRAAHSYEVVKKRQGDSKKADDYASYVIRLPADILINGLGQALAQLLAAAKRNHDDPHRWVYEDLQEWLCRKHPQSKFHGDRDLLEALALKSRSEYQWALGEAMAWLEWHKKLVTAYLKKGEEGQ
jgi:CRISPR-associated protein Cmr5